MIIQFTNFHYKYSGMDHSSSSFYSILIEPLKFVAEIDDIRNPNFIGNSSDISEPNLDRIDCDWEDGFCKDWSSSYLIPVANQKSKLCFKLGTIWISNVWYLGHLRPNSEHWLKSFKASEIFSIQMMVKPSQPQDIVTGVLENFSRSKNCNRFHSLK